MGTQWSHLVGIMQDIMVLSLHSGTLIYHLTGTQWWSLITTPFNFMEVLSIQVGTAKLHLVVHQ